MGFLSSLVNGISQGFSNLTNKKIAKQTNETNLAINQANLDYAREAWDKEVAYNWQMFNAENAYNDPSAIADRLTKAGVNVPMAMAGNTGGTASGSSSPSHNQPQQIPMQSYRVEPIRIEDTAGLTSMYKTLQEARGVNIDNAYKDQIYKMDLMLKAAEFGGRILGNDYQRILNYIKQNGAQYEIDMAKKQPQFLEKQIQALDIEIKCKEAGLPYISMQAQAEIDKLVAEKLYIKKQTSYYGDISRAKIAQMYADAALKNKQRLNLPTLTEEQSKKLGEILVSTKESEGTIVGADAVGADLPEWFLKGSSIIERAGSSLGGFIDGVISPFKPKGRRK